MNNWSLAEIRVFLIRRGAKTQQWFLTMRHWVFTIFMLGMAVSSMAQSTPSKESLSQFAQLPYHELVKIAQSDSSQSEKGDRLTFVLASRNKVPLDQITLTLELKKGALPLPIDAKGHFFIPFSEELMEENPLMISNQARGSLSLKFTLAVPEMGKMAPPIFADGKVQYQEVFQSLVKFKEAMKKVDSQFGEKGNQQLVVECVTGGRDITILQKFGSRKIKAGDDGSVWLLYDEGLFQEGAQIGVPEGTEFYLRPVSPKKAKLLKK